VWGLISSAFIGIGKLFSWIGEKTGITNILEKMFGGADGIYAKIRKLFMGVVEGAGYAYDAVRQFLEGNFDEAGRLAGKIGDAFNGESKNTYNPLAYQGNTPALSFQDNLNKSYTLQGLFPAPAAAVPTATEGAKADPNVLKHLAAIDKANADKKSKNAEMLDRVTGGGSKPVNISIQFEALNKGGITVQSTTLTEGVTQIEQIVTEMFLRVTNQANQMALG
jgi:hypothetical protein